MAARLRSPGLFAVEVLILELNILHGRYQRPIAVRVLVDFDRLRHMSIEGNAKSYNIHLSRLKPLDSITSRKRTTAKLQVVKYPITPTGEYIAKMLDSPS